MMIYKCGLCGGVNCRNDDDDDDELNLFFRSHKSKLEDSMMSIKTDNSSGDNSRYLIMRS